MNQKPEVAKTKTISKLRIISGVTFVFLSIVLTLSFISYLMKWKADQSQAGTMLDKSIKSSNVFGKIGDWLGNFFIFESIGIAGFIVAFLLFVFGTLILKKNYFKPWKTISHSLFFICWLPIFMGVITKGQGVLSGVYGFQIMDYLNAIIGTFGLWMILLLSIGLYFVLEFNLRPSNIKAKMDELNENTLGKFKNKALAMDDDSDDNEEEELPVVDETPKEVNLTQSKRPSPFDKKAEDVENKVVVTEELPKTEPVHIPTPPPIIETPNHTTTPVPPVNNIEIPVQKTANTSDIAFTVEKKDEEVIVLDEADKKSQNLVDQHGLYDHKLDLAKFQMPSISLLKDYGNENININQTELEENKNRIVGLLKNFNVGITEIKATIGPTITLYEIVPEAGIRVAQIKKLQDDIALNLSALGIRIIAPMPGKGTIGIEVPNQTPSMVSMRSVIASPKFQNTDMDLPVVFGKTISNEIFMADLAKMPHLLMAGATGQGKSVGINAILTSLIYKKHPSELKFVMVDPKKVELSLYSKIERHYLAKLQDGGDAIITDNAKVINTLNSLCIEMDNRYELLKNAFCKNIKEYNKKFSERKLNPENGHRYLPYIVLVVDEFADLIMTAGKEVEMPIARLAQLARAIGIHLIVATQRPSVNVITGMIKANFPARAAFRVISGVDSRTILDTPGAEQLVGKGDMLYFNGNDLIRLQCAFVDTPEVEKIAEFIGEQKGYPEAYQLPEYSGDESIVSVGSFDPNEKDVLFDEAAKIVVSTQQGSTSMLQRQLKLGYNRAGRIMDQLEASGIVGSFNGAKAREVLITDMHSLEQFLEELRK
ncbi:cell division protein FtsK [Elizabethkingia anophelis]|uniref:FtsK/SpoIIIE family DNA translocase n=1 Tax=Elizabethkingia anophelis TaxID=1117645 RepID=UPI0021A87BB1|nr:DNA translocase FtsK 4TM domain-containing protein [Elizabethkingia anophelis]MCT3827838.1 DNA translocase FtsK 4TM domain-containing protein [Elizabethkingia anophelis]MCT3838911.1 DNA translocase FtsK 4TM domain-containing protein [Elizabethkingia anophelis]MCT3842468.1 DNA translocase FtsK 4TM domain-containing protein [Elizabethkingia anophelis]MCT3849630.1 DNA translocase FtsK 4TM domain-containing protein [Elizabethkingia anophelis]